MEARYVEEIEISETGIIRCPVCKTRVLDMRHVLQGVTKVYVIKDEAERDKADVSLKCYRCKTLIGFDKAK